MMHPHHGWPSPGSGQSPNQRARRLEPEVLLLGDPHVRSSAIQDIFEAVMRRCAAILVVVLAVAVAPATAGATSRDVASTHTYLAASYRVLHAAVSTWSSVEASIHRLDLRLHAECPNAGAGSPQNEEEQKLSYEAAGALWATGYHTDAAIVRTYVNALNRLTWSNPEITRDARRLARGLLEMAALRVPDICADVRAWHADGFGAMPSDVVPYDQHVEAIDIHEIPRRLLTPYVQPADRGLRERVEHLATRFEELEFMRGQADWIALLEVVGLNE
jgi:hypothetical protein